MKTSTIILALSLAAFNTAWGAVGPMGVGGQVPTMAAERRMAQPPLDPATVVPVWTDNFDSYAPGGLIGQGGWEGWDGNPAVNATVTSAQARSLPNSVSILSTSDVVRQFAGITTGRWVMSGWSYVPAAATGQQYFILLNTYQSLGPYNWSTQVLFDSDLDEVQDFNGTGALPLIHDQWVELRVEIDLDADVQTTYYNNQVLFTDSWTNHVGDPGPGVAVIAALDLYSGGGSPIYWDDLLLGESDSVVAFGFTHTPIGNAHLTLEPGALIVDNLGSSGQDGVSIDLAGRISNGQMFDVFTDLHDAVGHSLQTTGIGIVDGVDGQVVSRSMLNVIASDFAGWHLDMSQTNPSSLTAVVMQNGTVVSVIPGLPTIINAAFDVEPSQTEVTITLSGSLDDYVWGIPTSANVNIVVTFASFRSAGGSSLFDLGPGDYVIDFLAVGSPHTVGHHTRMDLLGSMPTMHITSEVIQAAPPPGVAAFGFTHTPIGNAHLTLEPGALIVDNLGSSGQDGVSIDLAGRIGNGQMFDVFTDLHDAVGHSLQTTGIGIVDGVDGQVVSRSMLNVIASDFAGWHLDMSQTNPSSLTAVVMQNGTVVSVIPGLPTIIDAEFDVEPSQTEVTITLSGSLDDYVWGIPTSANVNIVVTVASFRTAGGSSLFDLGPGDYVIDFLAVGSPHTVGHHTRMDLLGSMPTMHITSEVIQQGPPQSTPVEEPQEILAAPTGLISVSPNPFNPQAEIRFASAQSEHVLISVYDLRGIELRRLVDAALPAGEHRIIWNGDDFSGRHVSSGTYIVRMQTATSNATKRLTLLK